MTWLKRLKTAKTIKDWERCDSLDVWKSCAVGENRKKLENAGYIFGIEGYPYDEKLRNLGYEFSFYIDERNKEKAIFVLNEIIKLTKKEV